MKKITAIAAALLLAGAAQAQTKAAPASEFYAEAGYSFVKIDVDGVDLEPGALRGIIGFNVHPNLAVEGMLATGVKDDNSFGLKTKISSAYGVYLKPKYDFGNGFEIFGRLGYASVRAKLEADGFRAKTKDSDVSFGLGASYSFTKNVYGTVDYTQLFNEDNAKATAWTVGVGYRF